MFVSSANSSGTFDSGSKTLYIRSKEFVLMFLWYQKLFDIRNLEPGWQSGSHPLLHPSPSLVAPIPIPCCTHPHSSLHHFLYMPNSFSAFERRRCLYDTQIQTRFNMIYEYLPIACVPKVFKHENLPTTVYTYVRLKMSSKWSLFQWNLKKVIHDFYSRLKLWNHQ